MEENYFTSIFKDGNKFVVGVGLTYEESVLVLLKALKHLKIGD